MEAIVDHFEELDPETWPHREVVAYVRAAERMSNTMRGGKCFPKDCPQCVALKAYDRAVRRLLDAK